MAEHLVFGEHLTGNSAHLAIAETYLGQAHIAGTGPEGKTCRECQFWCVIRTRKTDDGLYVARHESPGYYGGKHEKRPLELKKAKCTKAILNKADRLIPHYAKACRLFVQSESPPVEKLEATNV